MQALRKPPATALVQPLQIAAPQPRLETTIAAIGKGAWEGCFPGELEGYEYLLAVEHAGIAGFEWRYVTLEENGVTLAAMPAFLTDYPLDTTLEGTPKRLIQRLRRLFPRFLMLKLACLGSPMTECGAAGFHSSVPEVRKGALLRLLLAAFESEARQRGYRLIGVKDVPKQQKDLWESIARPLGFRPMPGMATATLGIDFRSVEEYLARLSPATRKDMRRKRKALSAIRIERRNAIDDVLPQVLELYLDTKRRSEFQFEELTQAYFSGVLAQMKERAFCMLYYAGDRLLAANLLLEDKNLLLDKFFCMDGEAGRAYNLYFLSWFTNIQYCLDRRIPYYMSGQAGDESKLRLGSAMQTNLLWFKHANPLLNGLLRLIAPLLAFSEGEEA